MKKMILIGFVLILALSLIVACGSSNQGDNSGNNDNTGNDAQGDNGDNAPPPSDATDPPPPPETGDRCAIFEDMEMDVILYPIYPSSEYLAMFVGFEVIPGLEDGQNGGPWEYTVKLGDSIGECRNIPDDPQVAGRLFCNVQLLGGYKKTNKPWSLHVNGCPEAIKEIPLLSLSVAEEPAEFGKCGAEPPACGAKFNEYCACRGGLDFCLIMSLHLCISQ